MGLARIQPKRDRKKGFEFDVKTYMSELTYNGVSAVRFMIISLPLLTVGQISFTHFSCTSFLIFLTNVRSKSESII